MSENSPLPFEQVTKQIASGQIAPVYLLMGEEAYFIDVITDMLIQYAIPADSRDFNQTILYGLDTDVHTLIPILRRYPMMADRQLVVLKEAQDLKQIDVLESYLKNIVPSTIFVINYKYGTLDKRKKLYAAIAKQGVIFESHKIYESKIPAFITSYASSKGVGIDSKSAQMLTDYLGNNLKKVANEIDKLCLSLPLSQKRITPEDIEKNIGISKDFNNFELLRSIIEKDSSKAMRIALYFQKNPKNNPYIVTLSVLFNYFSNLLICYWATDKTDAGLARELNLKSTYQARDYVLGLRNYKVMKCMEIISLIRTYDAKGKGIDNASTTTGDLLKELLFKIMH